MKYICAWCQKELEYKNAADSDKMLSHGICDKCGEKLKFQMGVEIEEYIEHLPVPVMLVKSDRTVLNANRIAHKILNKESYEFSNSKTGEVFECTHAQDPAGCGRTIHCSGCVIRRTVTETNKTGKGMYRVPATGNQFGDGKIDMFISTEKIGNMVLLRIDEISEMVKV